MEPGLSVRLANDDSLALKVLTDLKVLTVSIFIPILLSPPPVRLSLDVSSVSGKSLLSPTVPPDYFIRDFFAFPRG